jgi:hypothetical protein
MCVILNIISFLFLTRACMVLKKIEAQISNEKYERVNSKSDLKKHQLD